MLSLIDWLSDVEVLYLFLVKERRPKKILIEEWQKEYNQI